MKYVPVIAAALALLPLSVRAQSVTNHEAPGNLAVTHVLKCQPVTEVKPEYTPADLFPALADCLSQKRYAEATQLFMVAEAYANFDQKRVTDTSAHQARAVLLLQALNGVDQPTKSAWSAALTPYATVGTKENKETCAAIRKLGPPTYRPDYMIQHGMGAFTANGKPPLADPFDAKAAWETTLTGHMKCA